MLTELDYAVIQVIVQFPKIAFGKGMCSLYEITPRGLSMNMTLRGLLDMYGVIDSVQVYLDRLVKTQYLMDIHGLWRFTSLCPCGRHSRYVNRTVAKRELYNKEGHFLNMMREVVSGKELNWTDMGQHQVLIAAKPKEDDTMYVRTKQSKTRRPKTNKVVAKVWNETTYRVQQKDKFLAKIAALEQRVKELE